MSSVLLGRFEATVSNSPEVSLIKYFVPREKKRKLDWIVQQ